MNDSEIAQELMDTEYGMVKQYGWRCGNDIKRNWRKYIEEVEVIVTPYLCEDKINKNVLDELTAENWHSLRNAIQEIQRKY